MTTLPHRAPPRSLVLPSSLALGVLCLMALAITLGSSDLSLRSAVPAVFGLGDPGEIFIVRELRLPRVLVAVGVGATLGASGTLMQGLMRNPLASPDIIGVTGGASLATVLAISAAVGPALLPLAAGAGALLATIVLQVLAHSNSSGARLVLVGIGLHAIASAGVTLTIARIPADRLGAAEVWLAGSLHGRTWTHVTTILLGAALTLPLAYGLLRHLKTLELGDELAVGAGVRVTRTRHLLLLSSALLAGVAVAVSGPIAFVALGAPHIARRLVGPTSPATLTTAVLVGALLVLAADLIGKNLLAPTSLAAGVVTAALGAPYLLWLLHRMGRTS
ncbi:iron complex transport system permease protein [Janibacter cremeus]|uniref:Iron complex transport system permease protein n=2 Tax=Janibacter cremeus TaxID=1285192 RepID=A0A852VX10_9MICO|nr:iron complex transport system permease protein [Janibacter cremeus]